MNFLRFTYDCSVQQVIREVVVSADGKLKTSLSSLIISLLCMLQHEFQISGLSKKDGTVPSNCVRKTNQKREGHEQERNYVEMVLKSRLSFNDGTKSFGYENASA